MSRLKTTHGLNSLKKKHLLVYFPLKISCRWITRSMNSYYKSLTLMQITLSNVLRLIDTITLLLPITLCTRRLWDKTIKLYWMKTFALWTVLKVIPKHQSRLSIKKPKINKKLMNSVNISSNFKLKWIASVIETTQINLKILKIKPSCLIWIINFCSLWLSLMRMKVQCS